jgi:hypothetical protein
MTMATNQLRNATVKDDISTSAALLRLGVDISDTFEYSGQKISLLENVTTYAHKEIAKLLLAHHQDIDAATPESGTTPFHVAVIKDPKNGAAASRAWGES